MDSTTDSTTNVKAALVTHRVEISGWDQDENFFVEESTLECEPGGQKRIQLQSVVRQGSVVFVRQLDPGSMGKNIPIPYQAAAVAEHDAPGRVLVSLLQMQPRVRFKENAQSQNPSAADLDYSSQTPFSQRRF